MKFHIFAWYDKMNDFLVKWMLYNNIFPQKYQLIIKNEIPHICLVSLDERFLSKVDAI